MEWYFTASFCLVNDDAKGDFTTNKHKDASKFTCKGSEQKQRDTMLGVLLELAAYKDATIDLRAGDVTLLSRTMSDQDRLAMYNAFAMAPATMGGKCVFPFENDPSGIQVTYTPESVAKQLEAKAGQEK